MLSQPSLPQLLPNSTCRFIFTGFTNPLNASFIWHRSWGACFDLGNSDSAASPIFVARIRMCEFLGVALPLISFCGLL